MDKIYIDINCDVGEGIGNEAELFPHISSCNIACGGHAGDAETMLGVLHLAKENGIKVGAHPSYPDRENFGRLSMTIAPRDLKTSIQEQISLLEDLVTGAGLKLHHIKAHGALYNDIASNAVLAMQYLESIEAYREKAVLYVPPRSVIAKKAGKSGFDCALEAFGDRAYRTDLSLVSRQQQNAVIASPKAVLQRIVSMARDQVVPGIDGELLKIRADTFCIHGDTPNALQILMYLSSELPKYHICIKK